MQRRDALALVDTPVDEVCAAARALRTTRTVTYSPKVFIPLTKLCRDVCHYCTFARPPVRGQRAYLTGEEVLAVARAVRPPAAPRGALHARGQAELRYRVARDELAALGCSTTLEYLARCAKLVLEETSLLPHLNPGVMTRDDLAALRQVSVSQGIMLETASSGSRRAAVRTSARPTSSRRRGSPRSTLPAASRCRSTRI